MPTLWHEGLVTRIETIAPDVRQFWIQVPALERFDFQGGQFITLDLPIGDKRLQRWRSYSIANPPDGSNMLELCIVRSTTGLATRYLFEEINVGSTLRFKGPEGGFVLPEVIDKDMVFIATGTGVAPFRSMLLDVQATGKSHRNLHLIFGTRYESGLLYRAEFEGLTQQSPNFQYDVALSREADWPGYRGHLHQIYLEKYREVRPDVAFYICGWSTMINEAVANLLIKLGYAREQIHYELYG